MTANPSTQLQVAISEREPQPEPREARTDPDVRVAVRRPARFDDAGSRTVVDHPLVVDVEQVEIHANAAIARAHRKGFLHPQVEVVDRIRAVRAARLDADGLVALIEPANGRRSTVRQPGRKARDPADVETAE